MRGVASLRPGKSYDDEVGTQSVRGESVTEVMAGRREFKGVQVLRGVAALAVVAGHSTDYLVEQNGWIPRQLAWIHGPAGVDIFFVISGFVMMISSGGASGNAHRAKTFLWRRLLRIVPLYWGLTALKLLLVAVQPGLSQHGRPSTWNAIASFLFIPSIGVTGEIRPVIPVGWTLTFEMLFYVLFAAALSTRRSVARFLLAAIFVLALVGGFRSAAWPVWTAFADPIVLEFLAGVGIAMLVSKRERSLPMVGGCLMVAGFVMLAWLSPSGLHGFSRPLVWGLPAAMVVLGAVLLEARMGARYPGWLLLLGNASYSIYLVQSFLFPLVHMAFAHGTMATAIRDHAFSAGLAMMMVSTFAAGAVGTGLYWTVERRMTDYLKGLGKPRSIPATMH